MKQSTLVIIAVVAALAVGVGAFFGGAAYGKAQRPETTDALAGIPDAMRQRFAQGQGDQNLSPRDVAGAGQGISGTITKVDGDTIVLSTDDGPVKIYVSDTTTIQKTIDVAVSDLEADTEVMVIGTLNDDGSIAARNIRPIDATVVGRIGAGFGGGQ